MTGAPASPASYNRSETPLVSTNRSVEVSTTTAKHRPEIAGRAR
jgi:hypothetical protein